MVIGSFGLILGLRLEHGLLWWLQLSVCGLGRLLGLIPVRADVDGPRPGCPTHLSREIHVTASSGV
jgi:hypothetical protein